MPSTVRARCAAVRPISTPPATPIVAVAIGTPRLVSLSRALWPFVAVRARLLVLRALLARALLARALLAVFLRALLLVFLCVLLRAPVVRAAALDPFVDERPRLLARFEVPRPVAAGISHLQFVLACPA